MERRRERKNEPAARPNFYFNEKECEELRIDDTSSSENDEIISKIEEKGRNGRSVSPISSVEETTNRHVEMELKLCKQRHKQFLSMGISTAKNSS